MAWIKLFLYLFLAVIYFYGATATHDAEDSCVQRCGNSYNRRQNCQCNKACVRFNNCCEDYNQVCQEAICGPLAHVSGQMWNNDVNRLPDTAFDLNYQGQVSGYSSTDNASQSLFTRLDEDELRRQNYLTYISLFDNYDPIKGVTETPTPQEELEMDNFLNVILQTRVMGILYSYLECLELVTNLDGLRDVLYEMWFEGYPRSGNAVNPDTSGFEHVLVGEFKSQTRINGFHGWLSFYLKEKAGILNYRGYMRKGDPHLLGASFDWEGRAKSLSSFMVGPSPEFEIAIFSLCFLTHGRKPCHTVLGGHNITIQTYNVRGHVATAFMVV